MQIVEYDFPAEWPCLYIIPISDTHIGDPRFNEAKLLGYIDWIMARENAYVVLNGDILDAAIKGSVGDTYEATMTTNEALKYARRLFAPLKDRILAVTEGNHERRITKDTSVSPMDILSDFLDVPFHADGVFLKLRVGKGSNGKPVVYTAYFTHGHGGGRTIGGKGNNLQRMGHIVLADLYSQGHIHTSIAFQDMIYVPDLRNGNMLKQRRTYVSSGAFLDWGGYAQQQGYAPGRIGSVRIRLDGRKKDVHASV